jgi:hypothetical protein
MKLRAFITYLCMFLITWLALVTWIFSITGDPLTQSFAGAARALAGIITMQGRP